MNIKCKITEKFSELLDTDIIPLNRNQLDFSSRAIIYIQRTKNKEIKDVYRRLIKSKVPLIYELLVYKNGENRKNGKDLYHVYGQEVGNPNAFILGALLSDNRFDISTEKFSIVGVIRNNGDKEENKKESEVENLNGLYGKPSFKIDKDNGDIIPIFPLSPRNMTDVEEFVNRQKRYPLPSFGFCPEGYSNCISNCNYHMHDIKDIKGDECSDKRCGFTCILGKELKYCDSSCNGYLRLSEHSHCCKYEFGTSCSVNIENGQNMK